MNEDIYYINIDERTDRKIFMENEFKDVLPENVTLQRWSATKNKSGWIGCILSHSNVLKHMISKYNTNFYMVMEDDCKINDKIRFKAELPKYLKYLKDHSDKWDLFLGGGIYAIPIKIICRDPFIIECDWIVCSHFVIYNNKSANKVITYADSNNYKRGIDNMNAESNRKRIWVPYPLLCDQVGNDTNIGTNAEYLEKINKAFKEVHKRLDDFVAKSV
jgi:hypothetical protein